MWRTSSATPSDPRDRSREDTNARRAYSPVDSIDVTYLAPEGLHALHGGKKRRGCAVRVMSHLAKIERESERLRRARAATKRGRAHETRE